MIQSTRHHALDDAELDDAELEALLRGVYVGEGYTDPELGKVAFEAAAVRARGEILFARAGEPAKLAGIIIVVPPDSPARRFAKASEAELQLLATAPEFRRLGIGRALVEAAVARAVEQGFERLLLWTQPTMLGAQRLYSNSGFLRVPERDYSAHGTQFWFYERDLDRDP